VVVVVVVMVVVVVLVLVLVLVLVVVVVYQSMGMGVDGIRLGLMIPPWTIPNQQHSTYQCWKQSSKWVTTPKMGSMTDADQAESCKPIKYNVILEF
jgi:hypothetical protein